MADDFSSKVAARQPAPKLTVEKPNPLYQQAASELRSLKKEQKPTKTKGIAGDTARFSEIRSQLPDQAKFNAIQEELRARRSIFQKGFGQNLLDDQVTRLGRILKRRRIENTSENQEKVLNSLLSTVREQKPYSASNYLFNPDKEDEFDGDAAEVLNVWSMANLTTKFTSPKELYDNFAATEKKQEALREEAADILQQYAQQQTPDSIVLAVAGGEVIAEAARFGEAVDRQVAEVAPDALTKMLYSDNTAHQILRLAALGNDKDKSIEELTEALGNRADAKYALTNAYFSHKAARPNAVYIPFMQTPDGRTVQNGRSVQHGLEIAFFGHRRQKKGYNAGEVPPEEAKEMREWARKRARRVMAPLFQRGHNIWAWDDPQGMKRDYIEGRGALASVAKTLEIANSVVTLGLDEYMGDIPDKTVRAALALLLPRSAAGKLVQQGEDVGTIRRPEFFGTLLGDTAITNAFDYLLRLDPIEFVGASFKRAREDYADEGGDFKGRPAGVLRHMANNYGSAEHIDTIVSSDDSAGRLLFEFGDVFISPFLGKYGEENPGLGKIIGAMPVITALIYSPDALMGLAFSPQIARATGRATIRAAGLRGRAMMGRGTEKYLMTAFNAANRAVPEIKTIEDSKKYISVLFDEAARDPSGAAQVHLRMAGLDMAAKADLMTAARQAPQRVMDMYGRLRERSAKLLESSTNKQEKAQEAVSTDEALRLQFDAAQDFLAGAEAGIQQRRLMIKQKEADLKRAHKAEAAHTRLWGKRAEKAKAKGYTLKAEEVDDLLKVIHGDMTPKKFLVRYADDEGLFKGVNEKILRKRAPGMLRRHLKALPGVAEAEALKTLRARVTVEEKTLRKNIEDLNQYQTKKHKDAQQFLKGIVKGVSREDLTGAGMLKVQAAALAKLEGFRRAAAKLEDAEDAVKVAKALDDGEVNRVGVQAFQDYLASVRKSARAAIAMSRIPDEDYARIVDAISRRAREDVAADALAMSRVRAGVKQGRFLAKMPDDELIDALFTAEFLTNVWKDPYGFAQLEIRSPNAAGLLFRDWRTWATWAAITLKELGEHYTFFKTNLRFLDIKVRGDIDEEAKAVARRTQDILDMANLILDNIDNPAAAARALDNLLISGGIQSIKSRWNLPFTPQQEVTLTGLVGLDASLIRMASDYFLDGFRAHEAVKVRKGGKTIEMSDDMALNAAIRAFVSDKSVLVTKNFFEAVDDAPAIMSLVKSEIKETFLKNAQEFEMLPDTELLEIVRQTIVKALGKHNVATVDLTSTRQATAQAKVLFHKAVVLGAMQKKFTDRLYHILGPRFNERMALSMNYYMGMGQRVGDEFLAKDFTVGDYVIMRSDSELANKLLQGKYPDLDTVKRRYEEPGVDKGVLSSRTPEQVEAKVENMTSAKELVDWMAENALSETYRNIAKVIAPHISGDVALKITRGREGALGSVHYRAAGAPGGTRVVELRLREAKRRNTGMTEGTIIHELLHAATVQRLAEGRAAAKGTDLHRAFQDYSAFFKEVKAKAGAITAGGKKGANLRKTLGLDDLSRTDLAKVRYGVSNDREFLTNFFQSPPLQRVLEAIREPKYRSAFNHTSDILGDALGIQKKERNAFGALVQATTQILEGAAYKSPQAAKNALDPTLTLGPSRGVSDVPGPQAKTGYTQRVAGEAPAKKSYKRMGSIEGAALEAVGRPAVRINKIEGNRVYLNDGRIVSPEEIVHRDIQLSILDAVDGFALWGLETVGTLGRVKVNKMLRSSKATYARMVAHSVDAQGNVRMIPQDLLVSFNRQLDEIVKELDEAISEAKSTYRFAKLGTNTFNKFVSWWKQSILFGLLIPRPAYFMNQWFGDFSQIALEVGWTESMGLSLMGSLGYMPIYGKALQNAAIEQAARVSPGATPLPLAVGAIFNTELDKVLRAGDDIIKGLPEGDMTAARFYGEAIEDGIGEFLRVRDFGKIIKDDVRRLQQQNPGYFEALTRSGFGTKYVQRTMELKIREVTRRQRLLLYTHLRVNRRMDRAAAKQMLTNTMYDWTYSVSRMEREMLGELVLFYTLTKNAFAQVFRTFFEGADIGTKEFLKKYIRGDTRVQRLDLMSRLSNTPVAGLLDPERELSPEEQKEIATKIRVADWMQEYPLLTLASYTKRQTKLMLEEGGYYKLHYGLIAPKATPVEYAITISRIAEAVSALVFSMGDIVDPTGKVIPFSTNRKQAALTLVDEFTDELMVPVYGSVAENLFMQMLDMKFRPKSEYGRRMRAADMTTVALLEKLGIANAVIDPRDKTKRVTFVGGPLTDAALAGVVGNELYRLRTMLAIVFPEGNISPANIRAVALEGGPNAARLQAAGNTLNLGRAMAYNGETEAFWRMDDVDKIRKKYENRLKRMAKTPVKKGD